MEKIKIIDTKNINILYSNAHKPFVYFVCPLCGKKNGYRIMFPTDQWG